MPERTQIDEFRRALAGAARAIARDPEVEVAFASEPVPASGKTARVPSPGPSLQAKLVAEARGAADAVLYTPILAKQRHQLLTCRGPRRSRRFNRVSSDG